MKKEGFGYFLAAVAAAVLALNTYQIRELKQGMWELKDQMRRLSEEVDQAGLQVMNRMEEKYSDFEALLEEENSLFREKTMKLSLENGKIRLKVNAEPKVKRKGQRVTAVLNADGQVFEEPVVGGSAVFEAEPAGCFQVSVRAETAEETQEEEIGTVYPASGLALSAAAQWVGGEEEEERLALRISAAADGALNFDKEELEKAELILVKTGQDAGQESAGEGGGSSSGSAYRPPSAGWEAPKVQIPEGERVTAGLGAEIDPEILDFYADLSAYGERGDGSIYDVYCLLTLKSGVQFISQTAVADFCFEENGGGVRGGQAYLYPVF